MKLLARTCAVLSCAVLMIGIVLVLSGCQGTTPVPTTTAASPLPLRNFTDTPPVSPTSSTLPTLTSTPLPAPTNPTVSNPSLQTTPAPMATRSVGDGDWQTWREPRPSNSNASVLTAVPTAKAQALSGNSAVPSFNENDLYIHVPPQAKQQQPLRILLVLHGMGARGDSFAQSLISTADGYNWVVVAPTMPYRDYMDLAQLTEDDLKISQMLNQLLDSLPSRLGLKLRQHILVYGFSRGAQLAHRFALFHPERVESVVTMSAGSYTLPSTQSKEQTLLPFPYGIGDLEKFLGHPLDWESYKRISFWVAVGERDTQPNDVPRAFDPYLGQTRVERAAAFAKSLSALGIDTHLVLFPNTGHEVTSEMRKSGLSFLHDDEVADHWDD
jgi:predicted esterase